MNKEFNDLTPDILIEDLIIIYPDAPAFLRQYGLICLQCGEPVWGTLGELVAKKNLDVYLIINEFKKYIKDKSRDK